MKQTKKLEEEEGGGGSFKRKLGLSSLEIFFEWSLLPPFGDLIIIFILNI